MGAELRMLIEAKAARIHQIAAVQKAVGIDRLTMEAAELQALIAEAAHEERLLASHRPAIPLEGSTAADIAML